MKIQKINNTYDMLVFLNNIYLIIIYIFNFHLTLNTFYQELLFPISRIGNNVCMK